MTILKEVRNCEKGLEGICEDGSVVLLEPLKSNNVKVVSSNRVDYQEFCDRAREDFQYYQIGILTGVSKSSDVFALPFVTYREKKS